MPPKRKTPGKTLSTAAAPSERRSKLAKENNITAREEAEIREAFSLFSEPAEGEKDGIVSIGDVRGAMVALNLTPTKSELSEFLAILDPDNEGFATFEPFVALCALKLHARNDEDEEARSTEEVDEAFRLFVGAGGASSAGDGGGDEEQKLTLAHLKRVAITLKMDIDETLLKDMILEANGGAGVGRGVGKKEFEEVMRRAGVWK